MYQARSPVTAAKLVAHGEPVRVRTDVLQAIYNALGTRRAECGGMLGGDATAGVITRFWFDEKGARSGATYSPSVADANRVIDEDWAKEEVRFLGFAHSHPPFLRTLSGGDERYIRHILEARRSLPRLLVPIIMSEPDAGRYALYFWVADRDGEGFRLRLAPVQPVDSNDKPVEADSKGMPVDCPPPIEKREQVIQAIDAQSTRTVSELGDTFGRVESAYDLVRLAQSRLVFCGVGGIRETVTLAARSGVEEFVLIDPGTYEVANLGTQPCFRDEVGVPKVDAVKAEILRVNPNARVVTLQCGTDELDDADFREAIARPMLTVPLPGRGGRYRIAVAPTTTVLVGGTDDFYAQARVSRLGLQFGCPTMLSAVYQHGVGAELTWCHPEVSRCCHRCMLWCRYEAFLKEGYRNTVTSHGTPIYATQRLSALECLVLMALLHHGTNHPRFGSVLGRVGQRGLVQIRLDPDFSEKLGIRVFDRVFAGADKDRILMDESVWLPQAPEDGTNGRRQCPECLGNGDLRASMGRFPDTRVMAV